jgi:hypothetical protein
MGTVVRNAFTEGLKADMYAYGFEAYESLPPVHEQVFEVVGSSTAYEQSTQILGAGEIVEKPENDPIVFENALEGFTVYGKNRTYAKGIEFSMEMVEDMPPEKIGNIVREYAARWGERTIQKKEEFAAGFFNYGGYTSGHDTFSAKITGVTDPNAPTALLYDGKPFFNLSNNLRALYPGGTAAYYNALALSLDAANLQTLYLRMTSTNNVDSRGKKIALKPTTLLVPSALTFTANNILGATNIIGSANNDINPMQGILNKLEWQYLTSSTAWFIGVPKKGIKFHNRKPLTFDFWQDQETGGYRASVIARWGAHVYDWRFWHGSNAATS